MRRVNQLTPLKIAQLNKVGRYADGLGLYLEVTKEGNKSWAFRYMIDGRARQQGLGPLHTVSLQEARERARQQRQIILDGRDPIEARREFEAARKAEAKRNITFHKALNEFLGSERIAGFQNDKHRKQWRTTLESVLPALGDMPLRSITPADVLRAIKPIWEKTPETASRLRGRIERVFDWAKPIHYFEGDNPAQWDLLKYHLKARPKVEHHKALPYAELPAFMAKLARRDSLAARCLEFTILTAVRTQESVGARWSEIDSATWTIPAARMKAKRDHRVALSKRAVAILKALPRNGERVFRLSDRAMLDELNGLVGNGFTVHGFRSAFSDWARDSTAYPRDEIEMALAHLIKDKSEAAYRRGDALDKRRPLMADWEKFVTTRA
jgi:integrase